MTPIGIRMTSMWRRVGTRFLPFADAASAELPLSRLLRLSLFQVSVAMAGVLLTGTLNRVMIVELSVPAWLVSMMVAVPLVFAYRGDGREQDRRRRRRDGHVHDVLRREPFPGEHEREQRHHRHPAAQAEQPGEEPDDRAEQHERGDQREIHASAPCASRASG